MKKQGSFTENKKPSPVAKVTLAQVAEAAGVSVASASYALNDAGSLGQDTRDRVKAVARSLGYTPNVAAKAMRTGKTRALGLIVPDLANPFFPQLAQTVVVAGREAGYEVFLTDTLGSKEIERESIEALARRGVDGVIWFPVDDDSRSQLASGGTLPTVVIDRSLEGFDTVLADCEQGGRLAARALLDAGHRKIAMVCGPSASSSARLRAEATRAALRSHAELVWEAEAAFSPDLDPHVVSLLARRVVTGVIAGSDLIALGLLREARKLGIEVPRDLSVVGFDDIPFARLCTPALTTLCIPIHEMGLEALNMLLRRIAHPSEARRRVLFDVVRVDRESVAQPPADSGTART